MLIKLLFSIFLIFATLISSSAFAHTALLKSFPENGDVIHETIDDLSLSFVGKIRLTKVSVKIDDQHVGDIDLSQNKKFAKQFLLSFSFKQMGKFQIIWRGLGEDGHVLTGMIEFRKVKT